jgi:hypothetical protein
VKYYRSVVAALAAALIAALTLLASPASAEPQYTGQHYVTGRVVVVDHGWTFWPTDATAPKWDQADNFSMVAWNTVGPADPLHTLTLRTYADYRDAAKWRVFPAKWVLRYDSGGGPYWAPYDMKIWFNMTAANKLFWASAGNRNLALNRAIGRAVGLWSPAKTDSSSGGVPSVMTASLSGPSSYDLWLVGTLYGVFS